jgi:hypothetical protein
MTNFAAVGVPWLSIILDHSPVMVELSGPIQHYQPLNKHG